MLCRLSLGLVYVEGSPGAVDCATTFTRGNHQGCVALPLCSTLGLPGPFALQARLSLFSLPGTQLMNLFKTIHEDSLLFTVFAA